MTTKDSKEIGIRRAQAINDSIAYRATRSQIGVTTANGIKKRVREMRKFYAQVLTTDSEYSLLSVDLAAC